MKRNITKYLGALVLTIALVNGNYLKSYPHLKKGIDQAPRQIGWGQQHPAKTRVKPHYEIQNDQFTAASEHENYEHHGRVQIKVYRGPDDNHHEFAPYGFWIKQPADDGY